MIKLCCCVRLQSSFDFRNAIEMGSETSKSERKSPPPRKSQPVPPLVINRGIRSEISSSQQHQQTLPRVDYNAQQSQANFRATYMQDQPRQPAPNSTISHPLDDLLPPPPKLHQVTVADVNKAFQDLGNHDVAKKSQVESVKKAESSASTSGVHQLDIEKMSRMTSKPPAVQLSATTYSISKIGAPSSSTELNHDTFRGKLSTSSPIDVRRSLINNQYLSDGSYDRNSDL